MIFVGYLLFAILSVHLHRSITCVTSPAPIIHLINITDQDRYWPVILSAAKNLGVASEILRCAQNDTTDFDW